MLSTLTNQQLLDRANRLRMRSILQLERAVDVCGQSYQLARAFRIREYSDKSARRADEALRTISTAAVSQ